MYGGDQRDDLGLLEGEEREKALRRERRAQKLKRALPALCALVLVLVIALVHLFVPLSSLLPAERMEPREEGELRVHFLDVGQGDCTVIEFPSGDVVLIDAGDGSFLNRIHTVRYLKALAPARLTMILTHADADHYGGFESLVRAFGADAFYLPAAGEDTPEYAALLDAVERSGAETGGMTRYGVIADRSGAYLACISPRSLDDEEGNEASSVFYLRYEGVGVMLAGDISSAVERRLVRENALLEGIFDCGDFRVRPEETEILKVSHHGSAYSSCAEWLSLLSPEAAVVSCGAGNSFSHPSPEALARISAAGAEIYRTDELGDVIVGIHEGGYTLSYSGQR